MIGLVFKTHIERSILHFGAWILDSTHAYINPMQDVCLESVFGTEKCEIQSLEANK